MRIAVCFSGQLRYSEETWLKTIEDIKYIFPTADFYYTTWDDQPKASFINRIYKQPKPTFNPLKDSIANYLKAYRRFKEKDWNDEDVPASYQARGYDGTKLRTEIKDLIRQMRSKGGYSNYQHLAHALTVRDFVVGKGYDLVVRARYDLSIDLALKKYINDFCQWVYEYSNPMGFHTKIVEKQRQTIDEHILCDYGVDMQYKSLTLHDFIIIHRADLFDPNLVFYNFEKKIQYPAEQGWYQILCKPYNLLPMTCSGFVRLLPSTAMVNEHFRYVMENPDDLSLRYNFSDPLKAVSTNLN